MCRTLTIRKGSESVSGSEKTFVLGEPVGGSEVCLVRAASILFSRLPHAHIEHVGSTSVPGCLGKGDIDILVRVSPAEFRRSRETLDAFLAPSTRNAVTDSYVEYDWTDDELEAAVHLVAVGGTHDDFHRFKALLLADSNLVQQYNTLKLRHRGRSMADYREAKSRFISEALAAKRARGPGAGRSDGDASG
jgi:GrpB-like predicted nucleotidyltransferase (UPF0157 family)